MTGVRAPILLLRLGMNRHGRLIVRVLAYLWASPNTALGLAFGLVACLFGAHVRLHTGALEFGGGKLGQLASRLRSPFAFSAVTFGHVILGTDHRTLARVRSHEQVHVRQYECWGPFFVPAYVLSSLIQIMRGGRPYFDNYFERQARRC